jgi:hypothetical protein
VSDDIEVHYNPRRGDLSLSCGQEAFARLRDAVVAEAGIAVVIAEQPGAVKRIDIQAEPPAAVPVRLRDRIALLGCTVIVLAIVFVMAVGVATIVRWML